MIDEDDNVSGFARQTWRRVIRWPSVRRDAARSRRQPRSRHWSRLWQRAALAPELRPTTRDD